MCTYAQAGQAGRTSGGTAASGPGKAAELSGVSARLTQGGDRKSTRLNTSHRDRSRMPTSA